MKPIKTFLFVSGAVVAGLVAISILNTWTPSTKTNGKIQPTNYGAFLAAQHALYSNDFDTANTFLDSMDDKAKEYKSVQDIRLLTNFLNGVVPENIDNLKKQTNLTSRIILDANLVKNNKWQDVYNRYKGNRIRLTAPMRIWSGVAINHITETLKFIDVLETNPSWQAFLRGQIYAELGKIDKAVKSFNDVKPEFLNIDDYLYLMSFYKHNKLDAQANELRTKFTTKPGGMFMINYTDIPDWSVFSGYKNQLAFNLIQTVAHTKSMSFSDLSLVLLHFAKNISDSATVRDDAINYQSGLHMMGTFGNYNKYFEKIGTDSPYYPFVKLRIAELNRDERAVRNILKAQPLFIPAINQLVGWEIQNGNKHAALKLIDNTLKNPDISTGTQAYMHKMRAETNFIFEDIDAAQKDLNSANILLSAPDPDVFSIQARIWAAKGENLEKAYAYSINLVKFSPSDTCTWDTIGYVIWAREGVEAALDVMTRVAEVANSCSALFEHLGDMYMQYGDKKLAGDAYLRAIELSEDGLSVKPVLEKKLKRAQK